MDQKTFEDGEGRVARSERRASGLSILAFMGTLLVAALSFNFIRDFDIPGASVILMSVAIGISCLLAIFFSPWVFVRVPGNRTLIALGFSIATMLVLMVALGQEEEAFNATPAGQREIAQRKVADAAQAEADKVAADAKAAQDADNAKTEQQLGELKDLEAQNAALQAKLKGCFGTFSGTINALRDQVKNALNDPSSFALVSTEVDLATDHNIVMKFRTKNQFNATVLASISAQINPDTCAVESVN